jgi:outer membrane lipoprotein-sorting protein
MSACGTSPTATSPKKTAAAAPVPSNPTPPPSATDQALGKELAAKAVQAFNSLKSFEGVAQTMEYDFKQSKTNKTEFNVLFKAPDRFRVQVRPGFENAGLKLVFNDGGDHLEIRMPGLLGVAKLKIGADDTRAQNSHGHPIMQVSEKGILNRLADTRGSVVYKGESTVEGKAAQVVSLTGPMLLKGVTEERIYIDKATTVPIRGEMLQGQRVIFASTIKQIKLNPAVSADEFDI